MAFSFGSQAASAAPATGSAFSFGGAAGPAATASKPPAFGGFGAGAAGAAPTSTTQSTFGSFGAAPAASALASASAAPSFGGFGAAPATSSMAPSFGGGFGAAPAASVAPSFGGGFGSAAGGATGATGATSQAAPAFGGFGATATTTAAATGFGGFGSFGKPAGAQTTGFFNSQPQAGGGGFGGFGQQPAQGLLQQQQQQQQQQQNPAGGSPLERLYSAVMDCSLFRDERDTILAKWNMLQASWGVGKAYYANNCPPLALSGDNPFCRFKTVSYSRLPAHKNEDGLIGSVIKKKASELDSQKSQIEAAVHAVLGSKPNLKVVVESIKAVSGDAASEVVFYVQESSQVGLMPGAATGQTRRIPASELHTYLSQPQQAQAMQRNGFENVVAKMPFSKKEIQDYLDGPPPEGIDPRLWKQAQMENPDPVNLIPVPVSGFKALQQRIQCQDVQAKIQQGRLDQIAEEIASLQKRHQETVAKIRDAKRRHLDLSHRVLRVLVRQEETRKIGSTIQPEEEKLRIQLEGLQSEISAPTQFKGRLNELLAQVRHKAQITALKGDVEKYKLDPFLLDDIKVVLRQQQEGLQALISVVKQDLADMDTLGNALQAEQAKKQKQY